MSDCLSDQELEWLAATDDRYIPSGHLDACNACRIRLEEIRRNLELHHACMELGPDRIQFNLTPSDTPPSDAPVRIRQSAPTLRTLSLEDLEDETPAISGYEIIEQVHRGAQGIVYKALHQATGRTVALKLLLHGPYASHRQKRRFEREIDLVAGLDHPNIVQLYDSGKARGRHYFAMQYIEGLPLRDYVSVNRLDLHDTLALFVKVCRAVAHAHARGVIHRDLKPTNILVDAEGEPHILDFGLAKPLDSTRLGFDSLATVTGEFFGTLAYTSPEQASCRPDAVETRSDVYSLGVILYELLTGQSPYPNRGTMSQILHHINETPPRRPSRLRPNLNDDVDTILLRALDKDPANRYQSIEAFAADITRYLTGRPIEAKPHSSFYLLKKAIQRNRPVAALPSLLLASLLVFAGYASVSSWRLAQERDLSLQAEAKAREAELAAKQQAYVARRSLYLSRIGLAFNAYEDHDIAKMKQMLDACPAELRGWEWHRLTWLSDRSLLTFTGHSDDVLGPIQSSFDGTWLATKSRDHTLRVWHSRTGHQALVVEDYDPDLNPRFADHGKALVTPLPDGTVGVWEIPSGQRLLSLPHKGARAVKVSSTGSRLASVGGGVVKLWDIGSGDFVIAVPGDECDFSGSATYLKVSGNERVVLCRASDGRTVIDVPRRGSGRLGLHVFHEGRVVVTQAGDDTLEFWTGDPPRRFNAVFHPDAAFLDLNAGPAGIISISDSAVKLWRIEDDRVREALSVARPAWRGGFDNGIVSSPDERFRAILRSGSFVLIHAEDAAEILAAPCDDTERQTLRFSSDSRLFLAADQDDNLSVWATDSGKLLCRIPHPGIRQAHFSPDGRTIISGSADSIRVSDSSSAKCLLAIDTEEFYDFVRNGIAEGGLRIISRHDKGHVIRTWDTLTGTMLVEQNNPLPPLDASVSGRSFDTRLGSVLCVHDRTTGLTEALHGHTGLIRFAKHISGDGRLVTASDDDTCKIWSSDSFGEARVWRRPGGLRFAAFSARGDRVATANSQGIVKIWDAARPENPLRTIEAHPGCDLTSVAFSPNGKRLVSAPAAMTPQDAILNVWDTVTGERVTTLTGHADGIAVVLYTPEGRAIVSGSWDGTVRVWDASSGECLAVLSQGAEVWDLAISPDGRQIASGGKDHLVKLWDIETRELKGVLAGHTDKIDALAFSPDGTRLITGDNDGHLICWNLKSGKQIWVAQTRSAKIYNALFTPDGKRVITGGKNQISVWTADEGRLVLHWSAHDGTVYSLDLTGDGQELLSLGHACFKIWPASGQN